MNYDNYMFDLYGTLIDINTDERAAKTWKKWGRWLDARGIRHPHYIEFRRTFFERDVKARREALESGEFEVPEIDVIAIYREMFQEYGNRALSEEELNEASYAFRVASRGKMRLYPGVEQFLRRIHEKGHRAYILSNAQASYTWPEIVAMGLDKMTDDQLLSSDYRCMKPDRKFYEAMFEKHKLDKSRTVMIGDSRVNDYLGAQNAGIDGIHLSGDKRADVFYVENIDDIE
ncbi:MAG: HAD family hydrolase [Lachnospiraceae bacterium]|nr:HAD family hydrolase [Lachnospiraceae bacterium]